MRILALAVFVLAAAGCGSSVAPPARTAAAKTPCAAQVRALVRIRHDVAAIERAAGPTKNKLLGSAAINEAVDRFLLDVSTAPLTRLQRNRLIDHAAAAAHYTCEQCFQALEANRPIVTIAHAGAGKGCPG